MRPALSRRRFLATGAAGLVAAPSLLTAATTSDTFRFAVIADTHIIDEFYKGPEGSPEDTASILKTSERLTAARDAIGRSARRSTSSRSSAISFTTIRPISSTSSSSTRRASTSRNSSSTASACPSTSASAITTTPCPASRARRPTSCCAGSSGSGRDYAVEHRGWKLIHLNNFLGDTWQAGHARYNKSQGSLGEEQLNWLEAELAQQKPTFIFIHYPLTIVAPVERADYGLHPLLKKHRDTVQRVVSGHWHRWFEFGRSFGPQHLVIAATRYDPDAWLIVEVDTKQQTHRLVNIDLVDWNTHYAEPFRS